MRDGLGVRARRGLYLWSRIAHTRAPDHPHRALDAQPPQDGIGSPVTDAECSAGYVYNTANAANSCAGTTCDVGSTGAIDQGACCRS